MNHSQLPKSGFLASASDALRTMLQTQAREVRLSAGQTLFEHGQGGDALYAITSGVIDLSIISPEGRKLTLDMMVPGSLFGEICLFDPGERTATATATQAATVLRISNADVLTQIRANPELAVDMIQLAGARMRWMGSQYNEQVFLPMPIRLARKVLYLTTRDGKPAKKLTLSQAELAEFVGTTREAVSKCISNWRRDGLVTVSRGGLEICDREQLIALAETDVE
jgi:CRP-like cAMP-binding protein